MRQIAATRRRCYNKSQPQNRRKRLVAARKPLVAATCRIVCLGLWGIREFKQLRRRRRRRQHSILEEDKKISHCGPRSPKYIHVELSHFALSVLKRMAKKLTKIQNARAEILFCSLNLLFGDVVVCENSLLASTIINF